MPTITQLLREVARSQRAIPFWAVEKDYALSYLLAGMAQSENLYRGLVLKGGTALRKYYFADYRFSEDLDFSAYPATRSADIDPALQAAVRTMSELLQERGAFRVELERLILREPHPGGQAAFTVRVQFPAHREPMCRLKVEITYDELLLWRPQPRALLHGFPEPAPAATFSCYSLEEIVAEKLRALLQSRARLRKRGWGASRVCRDYYDLWCILRHAGLDKTRLPALVLQKCTHRGIAVESPQTFFSEDLLQVARQEWKQQLSSFVINCPAVDQVLGEVQAIVEELAW